MQRQRHKLAYGYKLDANPPLREKADYDWNGTTAKGWHLFAVRDEMPAQDWVNYLPEAVLEQMFVRLEPVKRDERKQMSKAVQIVATEREIVLKAGQARTLAEHFKPSEWLDTFFPQNSGWECCRCPFKPICFDEQVASDIAGSGLYRPRTANHPSEGEE